MRKNVVIINDELGAMALGFSKAGYNISAIYVDWLDEKSVQTCKENWKKTTQILDLNCLDNRENTINEEVDFIAGKISFGTYSVAYKVRKDKKEDITVSQAVRLMKEKRPKYFLFQCNRIDDKNCLYNHLYDNIKLLGYTIGYNEIHTRAITGLPVEEKRFFLYGSLDSRGVDLKSLKNIDTLNYLSELASGSIKAQIESFKIDETVYQKSIKTIYANRYPDIIEPNLSDMCGIEYWSKEKNTPLVPTHIAKFDWVPAVLICESGREILLPRYHREFKTDCQKSSVSNECGECCYGVFCPLIKYCKKEGDKKVSCHYVEKIVWKMIDNN